MKKHIIRTLRIANRFKLYTGTLLIVISSNLQSSAQSAGDSSTKTAIVKPTIFEDNKKMVQVQFDNEKEEKFTISIKDKDGILLFSEVYQNRKFDKKFLLSELEDADKLYFIIRPIKNNKPQIFEISTYTRTLQDVVVNKL